MQHPVNALTLSLPAHPSRALNKQAALLLSVRDSTQSLLKGLLSQSASFSALSSWCQHYIGFFPVHRRFHCRIDFILYWALR